jgi:hypothetical protein
MPVHGLNTAAGRLVVHEGRTAFAALRDPWDELAARAPSPYTTHAWLLAFLDGFGLSGRVACPALHDEDGSLRAAACLLRDRLGGYSSATNDHSGDWDIVARDELAREALLKGLTSLGARRLILEHVIGDSPSVPTLRSNLATQHYRVIPTAGNRSPYLELPRSYDELLAGFSKNMRSQVARRGRQLEKEHSGELQLVQVQDGTAEIDWALDRFFEVEASGWKAREGTAILTAPGAEQTYRAFAHALARRGWLRLYLLRVGDRVVAGDLGVAIGTTGFLVKTGFDEELGRLSPGLVLRGKVLEASIEEGLTAYDFLGPDDAYKLRWTSTVRPRVTLRAYRGSAVLPALAWQRHLRPVAKRVRDRLRAKAD